MTAPPTAPNAGSGLPIGPEDKKKKKDSAVGGEQMELNMTSMIDVVFQLLIYFILTASFAIGEGVITAKLPQGSGVSEEEQKPPEQPLKIFVYDGGRGGSGYRLAVEGSPVGPRDFRELREVIIGMQHHPAMGRNGAFAHDGPVIIKPDARVRWQHVVNAFNATVAAEYSNVAFAQSTQEE